MHCLLSRLFAGFNLGNCRPCLVVKASTGSIFDYS
jgi:hypothetical protein